MSWESSIVYERTLNEEARRRLGGAHSADLLIRSHDFAVAERLQAAGEWEQAGRLLADGARALEAAAAKGISIHRRLGERERGTAVITEVASSRGDYTAGSRRQQQLCRRCGCTHLICSPRVGRAPQSVT